jgi:hypothetical protein
VADIRADCGLQEDTDRHLGIRGLRTELQVRITQALAHRIHTNESAGRQEVLALEGANTHRVLLGIDGVLVGREELRRSQLVTRIASCGGLSRSKGGRTLSRGEVRKALLGATVARLLLDTIDISIAILISIRISRTCRTSHIHSTLARGSHNCKGCHYLATRSILKAIISAS